MRPTKPTATTNQLATKVRKSTPDLQEQIRRRAWTVRATWTRWRARTGRLAARRVGGDSTEGEDCQRL